MKIATWNVNSLKVRLNHVLSWLTQHDIDVLCVQETKLTDDKFPVSELGQIGYRSVFTGQRTYNGVAIIARESLPLDAASVTKNIPGFIDEQQRVIAATIGPRRIVCAYFPNGQAPGTEKFAYKLQWLGALQQWLKIELERYPQLALLGDFNIAPHDCDVHDPQAWEGQNLVSPQERAAFAALLELGLTDTFRAFAQPERIFSWWDYRMLGFRRNAGLRIDHILTSAALMPALLSCQIDKVPRGWEQPSDHAPVIVELDG